MTLKEIAKQANVSISTVSRVINQKNTKAASLEVQERIWEIVRKSGYTPNATARNLKMGKNSQIQNTVPKSIACIYARSNSSVSDPFFSQIAKAIEQEAFKNNYFIRHSFTAMDIANPDISRQLSQFPVDGVVILGRYERQLLRFFTQNYKNVIYTGLNPMGIKHDQVVCDGSDISYEAISYLAELGHTKIGYIGEQNNEVRFSGYKEALAKLGLPFVQQNTANVHLSADGGYKGANILMHNRSDISAIFCANDTTAIGVIHALKEKNFRIPEDISVISVDDIETAQYLSPMLTSIHIPLEDLGRMTAKTLIDRINGGHRLPMKISLPFYIAKRDSCGKLSRSRKTFADLPKE
ncbi:LacI family DNA-binding transcriptional regulator [Blautia sp. MSJ-19]|uniref:LacI family DNA-binding transcriptional regulator n=1 Tax=Blautia sp. MSJ-19 TaxID=2841517 RepID=UPI001C0EF4DB|nr:LacI family DNA-binding transcriptional regulator [Blautia sp. MSJ-19]MBU5479782.1 LacI family DNA-binding transcriptional regulator [Blautia sp. MSJ-19]